MKARLSRRAGGASLSCFAALLNWIRRKWRTGLHNRLTQQPEEIVKEMLAHKLPEELVVASMVAAIALLQTEGHYSYITV
jgi:hypothetical protein